MTPVRAVLLDMDDTLCDSEGLTAIRLQAVRKALAESIEPELLARVMEEALTWDSVGVEGRFLNRMSRIAGQLNLDEDGTQFMRSVYNGVLMDNLRLYDGVEDTLRWLRARFKLGLITNGPSDLQRGKIDVLELERHFDCIAIGGEIGAYKPDPKIFEHCMTALSVTADQSIYIGDRTEADVVGAQNLGIIAIRIRKSYPFPMDDEPAPDHFLDSVNELPALMIEQGWAASQDSNKSPLPLGEGC